MNVLITTVLVNHSPSGVVFYYNRLAEDLRKRGINVQIVDGANSTFIWRKSMGALKRIMSLFGSGSRALYEEFSNFVGTYLAVRRYRNNTYDVIHAQDVKSGAAAYLALGKRVPVVLTCHFNDSPVSELVSRFPMSSWFEHRFSSWYKYLFSQVKNYVFTSGYSYKKSSYLLPNDIRLATIRNSVNVGTAADIALAGQKKTSQFVISNVGYVDERKNQQLLIQIGHRLRERGVTNFAIWLVGDGPKRAEYEALVDELALRDHVTFWGQQPNSWQLVAQSDLYVHTAINDNCPLVILEAIAVDTPVLALPVGGVPEMLPENFGILNGDNAERLTDEVMWYLDVDHRRELTQAQHEFADQHFNHKKSVADLVSFYQQIQQAA